MNRIILKWLLIGLILIAAVYLIVLNFYSVDIIGDLKEIRKTKTKAGSNLDLYHRNLSVIDSFREIGLLRESITFIDTLLMDESAFETNYLFEKGMLCFELGEYELAKYTFNESIKASGGSNIKSRLWRGFSFIELGMCDSAIIDAKFVLMKNSTYKSEVLKIYDRCGNSLK